MPLIWASEYRRDLSRPRFEAVPRKKRQDRRCSCVGRMQRLQNSSLGGYCKYPCYDVALAIRPLILEREKCAAGSR